MHTAKIPGKRVANDSPIFVASSTTRPVSRCARSTARVTMSRGASSASSLIAGMKRTPFASSSTAPSPRTASLMSASGVSFVSSAVGWNCTNSMSASSAPARFASA